jgi:glycosyltransferase involved in cell wall biosynthesis
MVTTSYPRFPGDGVGSFIEPIAKGIAARGHDVHLVAPWHPSITRGTSEDGVQFHFFRYAPIAALNIFGYAESMQADTVLRAAAWAIAPAAMLAGWFKAVRVAQKRRADVLHAHWVIPGGVIAACAAGGRPLVVSLHGSDVFVAERSGVARAAARVAFRRAGWITACSDDLRARAVAIGADPARLEVVPYGVDAARFSPDPDARLAVRRELGLDESPVVFAAGRLVSKKGFEYLIDAAGQLAVRQPSLRLLIAGDGDLRGALTARAAAVAPRAVTLLGRRPQHDIARLAAAADVVAVPSVVDAAGNVDGLPNVALEALATGTPVVASRVGGLPSALEDGVSGRLVPPGDPAALAQAIQDLLANPLAARAMGEAARARTIAEHGWPHVVERFEAAYERAMSGQRAQGRRQE